MCGWLVYRVWKEQDCKSRHRVCRHYHPTETSTTAGLSTTSGIGRLCAGPWAQGPSGYMAEADALQVPTDLANTAPEGPTCQQQKPRTCQPFKFLFYFIFLIYYFGLAHGMQKFPGQGSNPHHSSHRSHCSNNAESSTCRVTWKLLSQPFDSKLMTTNIVHSGGGKGAEIFTGIDT